MELSRQEYPALLVCVYELHKTRGEPAVPLTVAQRSLSPNQAVSILEERVKLIGKVNADIADWLRVRPLFPQYTAVYSSEYRSDGALKKLMSKVYGSLRAEGLKIRRKS